MPFPAEEMKALKIYYLPAFFCDYHTPLSIGIILVDGFVAFEAGFHFPFSYSII